MWFEYAYIDNHWLYLSAQYYHNLLSFNSCHFLYYLAVPGQPVQLVIQFAYAYIDNYLLYLSARY
jgi:hypothetical protein